MGIYSCTNTVSDTIWRSDGVGYGPGSGVEIGYHKAALTMAKPPHTEKKGKVVMEYAKETKEVLTVVKKKLNVYPCAELFLDNVQRD